ncbi:MAG TPA: hypothetical protein DEV85_01540 [Vibrio sp.]|uniref:hypothetical protein n=1 Tax=Vibrio TaxID=662 RepID=UPI000EC0296F|nr:MULTISPECIES: hypothetical protein [Vibrio]HCH00560.1 hypothetical protein [Vibrio sp.]
MRSIGDGADQEALLSDPKDILTQLNDAINNGTDLDDIVITKTDDGFEVTEAPKTVEDYFKGNRFYITSMSEYYHSSDNEGIQKVTFSAETNAVSLGSDSYDIEYNANGFSFLNDDGGSDGMERVIYQSDEFALAIADQGDMTFYSKMDFTTGLDPIHNIVESDFIGKTLYYVMDDSSGDSQGTKPFIVKMEFTGDLIDFSGTEYPRMKISDYNPGTGEFELVDPSFGDDMFWYLTDDAHNPSYHVHITGVTEDGLLSISPTTMSNDDFMVFYEDSQDLMPRILTENKELAFGLYTQWLEANQ